MVELINKPFKSNWGQITHDLESYNGFVYLFEEMMKSIVNSFKRSKGSWGIEKNKNKEKL